MFQKDESAKRKSVHRALFMLSRQPFFQLFVQIVKHSLPLCLKEPEQVLNVLKSIYDEVNDCFYNKLKHSFKSVTYINLLGQKFATNVFMLVRNNQDEYPDASLIDLIKVNYFSLVN